MQIKSVVVTNMISPYRVPLFNKLSKFSGIDLKVIVLSVSEKNRNWKIEDKNIEFEYEILEGREWSVIDYEHSLHINGGLINSLSNYKPDVIITSGYSQPAYWVSLAYSKVYGKKFIPWCGTTKYSVSINNYPLYLIRKGFFGLSDACISYGSRAAGFVADHVSSEMPVYEGCNTVDMAAFRNKTMRELDVKSFDNQKRDGRPTFIFVGQLIERKGIYELINSWPESSESRLIVIGDGPEINAAKRQAKKIGKHSINFAGYVDRKRLYEYYALADVLIFPSLEEVWGLVVNEALASGLYVICSTYAGCYEDLILDGFNGVGVKPDIEASLTRSIKEVENVIHEIRQKREEISLHAIQEYGLESHLSAFKNAIYDNTSTV